MTHVSLTLRFSTDISPRLLRDVFAFRHDVFVRRLGWVPPRGLEEVDFFDTLNPVHAICQTHGGEIVAAARLLPMDGPSMLRDVFPNLLGSAPCPADRLTWEISRFALRLAGGRGLHREALLTLTDGLVRFANDQGATRLVAVSDTRLERLVTATTGIPLVRLAPPQKVGNCMAVVGCADVNEAMSRLRTLLPDRASVSLAAA